MPFHAETVSPVDVDTAFLIVVGAHPRAECFDRALAYRLSARVRAWLRERFPDDALGGSASGVLEPLVLTDVWYLNDRSMRGRPVVSIGGPGVNALTAALADKLPSVFVIDDSMMVQMDPECAELSACCWGVGPSETAGAVEVFSERYMEEFLRAGIREAEE
ncbi:MAG: hypothetical protein KF768_06425 [Phycisphaeraceae bacterium]|nr:hypothetical protein [Phycisphaeraceae bacterium]